MWESSGSAEDDSSGTSIQGQRYASDGSSLGGEFQINTYTTDRQENASVVFDDVGDFIVVWDSAGSSGNDNSVLSVQGQRYASDGSAVGDEFQINTYTTDSQQAPKIAVDSNGDYLAVWHSDGSNGTDNFGFSIQRNSTISIFTDGFESGDTTAWSSETSHTRKFGS